MLFVTALPKAAAPGSSRARANLNCRRKRRTNRLGTNAQVGARCGCRVHSFRACLRQKDGCAQKSPRSRRGGQQVREWGSGRRSAEKAKAEPTGMGSSTPPSGAKQAVERPGIGASSLEASERSCARSRPLRPMGRFVCVHGTCSEALNLVCRCMRRRTKSTALPGVWLKRGEPSCEAGNARRSLSGDDAGRPVRHRRRSAQAWLRFGVLEEREAACRAHATTFAPKRHTVS